MYSYLVKISPWRPLAEAVDLARTCALEALKDSEIRRRGGARVDPTSESSVVAVNNFCGGGGERQSERHQPPRSRVRRCRFSSSFLFLRQQQQNATYFQGGYNLVAKTVLYLSTKCTNEINIIRRFQHYHISFINSDSKSKLIIFEFRDRNCLKYSNVRKDEWRYRLVK